MREIYKVCIYNNGIETIIHYPSADKEAPHLLTLPYKESLSKADELSFVILYENPGYDLIQGLKTKVKVFDTRDDSVVFSGRVIPAKNNMGGGKFNKEVTCEGAMNYLNDTQTRRWNFTNQTPEQILTYLLNQHNSKVDSSRQICLGIIEITQPITVDTNYETTLNAIITKLKNVLGGDLRVRETNNILYLDYLTELGSNNGVPVSLGYNLKDMVVDYDPTDIITRVIPLGYGEGINQLDIKVENGGIEYIEDNAAVTEYGIIEGVATNKDIQNAYTLKIYGQTVLNEKKQIKLSYSISELDLSVLTGHENEKYALGDTLHSICDVMQVDVYSRVIERSRDLINNPWNPTLTLSTRTVKLSDEIVSLKQRNLSLENAPQGSTYIDTFGYAENIDTDHNFQLPVWISPDILNVNRVRLHIDGQKYRAYEKGAASGGGSSVTSASGGGSTITSSSDGSVEKSSASGGGGTSGTIGASYLITSWVDGTTGTHAHNISTPHSHSVPSHTHTISIDSHAHSVVVAAHAHLVTIAAHIHNLIYGIFEDTYPQNVYVKVNGTVVAGPFGADGNVFSTDIDLTPYIGTPGQTYNVEVTSSRNGRVNVWASIQAFIQAK